MKSQVLKVLGALVVAVGVMGGPREANAEMVTQWMPSDLANRIFKSVKKLEGKKWSKKKAKFEAGIRITDVAASGNIEKWFVKVTGKMFLDFPYDVAGSSVRLTQTLSYENGFLEASSDLRHDVKIDLKIASASFAKAGRADAYYERTKKGNYYSVGLMVGPDGSAHVGDGDHDYGCVGLTLRALVGARYEQEDGTKRGTRIFLTAYVNGKLHASYPKPGWSDWHPTIRSGFSSWKGKTFGDWLVYEK